uniref:Decapping nuclease n=1 Tax=Steinernema glaseri TaxID=37863 RepID=A0A1I7Z5F5_9BILA
MEEAADEGDFQVVQRRVKKRPVCLCDLNDSATADIPHVHFKVDTISTFTFDADGVISEGIGKARKLMLPNTYSMPLDLNKALPEATQCAIDLFDVIMKRAEYCGKSTLSEAVENCPIVASRGAIFRIASSLHNKRESLKLLCCYYNDILFIVRDDQNYTDQEACKKNLQQSKAFEHQITTAGERCYVQTLVKLEDMQLFLNCEVDCFDEDGNQIELKSSQNGLASTKTWNFYSAEWFFQAVLAKTKTVVVGSHNGHMVTSVTPIAPEDLETDRGEHEDKKQKGRKYEWKRAVSSKLIFRRTVKHYHIVTNRGAIYRVAGALHNSHLRTGPP